MALALAVLALAGAGPLARADVTVTRNLGASGSGTFFEGGTFAPWSLGALPAGSFLKKVVINATLDSSNNQNYASELTLLVDPTPAVPGGDFTLAIGNGAVFSATNSITWSNGNNLAPSTVSDTKNAPADFPATLDLSTAGVFLGNGYVDGIISGSGGTWSGSISLTYAAPTKVAAGFSTLRPSQTLSSGTTNVTLSGTLSGSGPVYPAAGELVHVTINGTTQNASISGAAGAFSLSFAASALWAKDTPYTITYSYDGNATTLLSASDTSTTLTLSSKTVPTLTWPTASNITYGQALDASTFSGGSSSVQGSFSFTAPSTKPTAAGTYVASGTFTPSNTANFATVVVPTAFSLTVNPKTLTLAAAAVTPKTYDGTTAATLTGTLTGVETGDAGAVGVAASGAFASAGVGNNIGVNAACTLNGTQAGNYTLTQPGGLTGNITRAALTVTANNLGSLVGTALPPLTYTLSGFQNGEDAAAAGVTGVPGLSTTATLASPAGTYPITCTVNTLAAPNYSFTAVNGTLFIVSNLIWAAGTGTWDINTSAHWKTPSGAAIPYMDGRSALFDDSATGTGPYTVTLNTSVLPTDVTVNNPTQNYTLTGSGQIGGSGGLLKRGGGRLVLATSNSYSGATTIAGGLLAISNEGTGGTNPLGAYPGAPRSNSITLTSGGAIGATATAIGMPVIGNGTPVPITFSANRGIELSAGVQSMVKGHRATFAVNSVISGSGGVLLCENAGYNDGSNGGGGRYNFAAANTYTGDTIPFDLGVQDNGIVVSHVNALQNTTFDYTTTLVPNAKGFVFMPGSTNTVLGGLKGNKDLNLNYQSTGTTNINIGNNNQNTIYTGVLSQAAKVGITKVGSGSLVLRGVHTMTGGVTVTSGTLVTTATGAALGTQATSGTNGLTVASGATFAYLPTSAGNLNLGQGQLNLQTNCVIGAALGGAVVGGSAITSTVAATAPAGTVMVNVSGIPGVTVSSGSNNLITAASGLTSSGTTYTLGKLYNTTNFTVGALASSDTAISVNVTSVSALTTATWKGGWSGGNNVWAQSDGSTASNWTTNGTTPTALTPSNLADVFFTATNGATNQTAMVLGANMAIRSLTVSDTSAVTLNADGSALTLASAAGITVSSGAGTVTLNAPINLGAAQTWTNDSSHPLNIGGDIANGSNLLTIAGSGAITISGQLRYGDGGLTMNGAGTLTLSGANVSFRGNTLVNSGIVKAGNPYAFGMAISNVAGIPYGWGYANVSFGAGSTGKVQLNGNDVVLSTLITHANVGTPVVENASATPVTLTVTEATSSAAATATTFAGVLRDGSGGGSLGLQVTVGTLTLSGINSYTGDTCVAGGTLVLADNAGLKFVITNSSSNRIRGVGTVTLGGDFTLDTSAVTAAAGTWVLVDTTALAESFTGTFTMAGTGWSETANVWTKVEDTKTWTFRESDGTLSLVDTGTTATPYQTWATATGLTGQPGSATDAASDADPDQDGRNNLAEFAFNGNPLSAADQGQIHSLTADTNADGLKELVLTVAVRAATPAFSGSPSPTATVDGITYTIEGSTDLTNGGVVVTPVTALTTGLPALTGPTNYKYVSFSLSGSSGLVGRGFLRAKVSK